MRRAERALCDRENWDQDRCADALSILDNDAYIKNPCGKRAGYVRLLLALIGSAVYGGQMRRRNKDSDVATILRTAVSPAIVEYLLNGIRYMIGMAPKCGDIRLPIGAATNEDLSV